MASELKQKAVKGAAWLGVGSVYRQFASLLVTGILARLLMPEAFGLVGMAAAFTAFIEIFQEFGLSHAVIQRKDITDEQLSTIFVVTVCLGAVLGGVTVLASPLVAAFFGEPELSTITKLAGLGFFIGSFVHVHAALLRKALDFRKLVVLGMISTLVSSAVGITLALLGFGVYALVFKGMSGGVVSVALMWLFVRWRPRAAPRLSSVKSMLGFGGNVTGTYIVSYFREQAHYLIIGRLLGASALGFFVMAFRIMLLPLRRITSKMSQVAFPTFSAISDDKRRVRRGFTQMTNKIALASFPAMAGLFLVAPEAVSVVLGEKWRPCIFLLQVLALTGALESVTAAVWTIFRSQGRADLQFRYEVVSTIVVVGAYVIGLRWGIKGIAVAYTIAQSILIPVKCRLAFRLIGLSFGQFYRAVRTPLLATLVMIPLVLAFRVFGLVVADLPKSLLLCGEMALGGIAYTAALQLIDPKTYAESVAMLKLLGGRTKKSEPDASAASEEVPTRPS